MESNGKSFSARRTGSASASKENPKKANQPNRRAAAISRDTKPLPAPATEAQQLLLSIFKDSFSARFETDLTPSIQRLKQHLFDRKFDQAFGSPELLETYAVRWSPSRALAYMDLLSWLPQLSDLLKGMAMPALGAGKEAPTAVGGSDKMASAPASGPEPPAVLCLGGGAGAEVMAFAGNLHSRYASLHGSGSRAACVVAPDDLTVLDQPAANAFTIRVIDIADWTEVIKKLEAGALSKPPLAKHASAMALNKQAPYLPPGSFAVAFCKEDILDMEIERMATLLRGAPLVTLMFTLNELYSTSMSKTTNFLLSLTYLVEPGTLLLVVDSPGSYSTVAIGRDAGGDGAEPPKKYPMQWLLNHTLMESSSIGSSKNTSVQEGQWERLVSEDSKWFRHPPGLRYPLELEDMRYQVHLYARI
jgi:25S rRNA (uracil2843-N3)-methyltransferase